MESCLGFFCVTFTMLPEKLWIASFFFFLVPPAIIAFNENITYSDYQAEPVNVVAGNKLTVVKGISVRFSCPAVGVPKPVTRWSKKNSSLIIDSRIFLAKDHYFQINAADLSDSGEYVCTASNTAGTTSQSIHLFVGGNLAFCSYAS